MMPEQICNRSPATDESDHSDHILDKNHDPKGISILKKTDKDRKEIKKQPITKVNGLNKDEVEDQNLKSIKFKEDESDIKTKLNYKQDNLDVEKDKKLTKDDSGREIISNGNNGLTTNNESESNIHNSDRPLHLDDEDSSNIVITPDITDFSTYGNDEEADLEEEDVDDMEEELVDEDLEGEEQADLDIHSMSAIQDLCGNELLTEDNLTQPNTPLSAERLYSAYSAYSVYSAYQAAAAAAAAATTSVSNPDHFNNNRVNLPQDNYRSGCRSLVCDTSGVIIAEMVYRCLVCRAVHDSINGAQTHYLTNHTNADVSSSSTDSNINGQMPNLFNTPKPVGGMNLLSQLLRGDSKRIEKWQKMKSMQNQMDFNVLQQQKQQQQQLRQQLRQQNKLAKSKLAQQQRMQHIQQRIQEQKLQQQQRWKQVEQQQLQHQLQQLQQLQHLKKQPKQQEITKLTNGSAANEGVQDSMDAFKEQIRIHLRDQFLQSPLAEILQRGDSSFNNNIDLSFKLAALQETQSKPQFGDSFESTPQSPDQFNEDDDQMHNFSPNSDLLEHKSDDSSLEQSQFNPIPELSSLLTSPPKPGTVAKTSPNTPGSSRGGFVTCAVCSITKFYASVQRRYGQFTCMGCAKFFGRFLAKPKKYNCPTLGSCQLNTSPRCKACLLLACINTYTIDEKRKAVINENRPVQKNGPGSQLIGRCSDPAAKHKKLKMKPFSVTN